MNFKPRYDEGEKNVYCQRLHGLLCRDGTDTQNNSLKISAKNNLYTFNLHLRFFCVTNKTRIVAKSRMFTFAFTLLMTMITSASGHTELYGQLKFIQRTLCLHHQYISSMAS